MITRVLLRNWRGYQKLALDLGPGLTFVIADNGVGKTSLVNGVAWAIFGEASGVDGAAAIRAGTDETSAEVEFALGDLTVSLVRSLRRDPGAGRGRPRPQLRVQVDGHEIDPADLPGRLAAAAEVPGDILPQLMFVPEMQLTHEGGLFSNVQEHLASLLGIDALRRAARNARVVQANVAREIRSANAAVKLDRDELAKASNAAADIAAESQELDAALVEHEKRRDELDRALRQIDQWSRYDELLTRYQERLDQLRRDAEAAGLDPDPDRLSDAADGIVAETHELHAALAVAGSEHDLVTGLVSQLESADPVCPVCLRPVDDDVAQHASEEHRRRLAELEATRAATERRQQEVDAAARKVTALATALARLHPPDIPESPRPTVAEAEVLRDKAQLDVAIAAAIRRKGALGEQLRQAEHALDEAAASSASTEHLERLHAVAATASSLVRLATAEADARTERSLDPISQALAQRWAEFFVASPARPRLAGPGHIELGHGGGSIPYASFSGGEKTLASLLTRLLFVASATGLHSMWLDEPLEHLDPANRSRVARLLAQVAEPGRHLHQLVVTTYEEGLARSMVDRDEHTDVIYVSTDPLL